MTIDQFEFSYKWLPAVKLHSFVVLLHLIDGLKQTFHFTVNSVSQLTRLALLQVFPGTLLQYTFRDPENPRHRLARTEVQRRDEYIKLLHQQLGEQHTLVLLVKQCLDDEPSERPSAQELLRQLEGMRAQIEDPYQRLTREKVIRTLKEKYQSESPGLHTQKVGYPSDQYIVFFTSHLLINLPY